MATLGKTIISYWYLKFEFQFLFDPFCNVGNIYDPISNPRFHRKLQGRVALETIPIAITIWFTDYVMHFNHSEQVAY